ncbi:MAG: hypothetical protein P9M06_04975 [Candidatus Saelkia tenebricola]|nr:hypothetical protein [Candidatus Saelkia tenebricola]
MKNIKLFNKIILIYIVVFFYINLSYARRIHNPTSSFLSQLSEYIEELTIRDAAYYDFFRKHWGSLKDGLRISINEDSFLEIRKSGSHVVVQIFGDTTEEESRLLVAAKKNLRRQAFNSNSRLITLDFQSVDLSLEPLETYTILGISDLDFAIIAQDAWRDGLGSGINSARGELLSFVDNMARVIDISIEQGVISPEDVMSGQDDLIQALYRAQDEIDSAIKNLKLGFEYRIIVLSSLENLRYNFDRIIGFLDSSSGDMAYRILYREYFIPFRESMYDDL